MTAQYKYSLLNSKEAKFKKLIKEGYLNPCLLKRRMDNDRAI